MKHLTNIFNALRGGAVALLWILASPATAQDSIEVSLLTCQPHEEVYSLYGHTAIRYREWGLQEVDIAFNYGVFNFRKPFFVGRFVLGWTDYELGACPYPLFQEEYRRFGSRVTEQVLNLTREEKLRLKQALVENMKDENRVYRYNYFYNNCTTKARDIIEQSLSGTLVYDDSHTDRQLTYRKMVHEMTKRHPWATFGNDILLGIRADLKTTQRQQEFLPHHLMNDFDHARILEDGKYRPLVKERRVAVEPGVQTAMSGFPLSPTTCAVVLSGLALILFAVQWRLRRTLLVWDLLLLTFQSVVGLLLFVMLFSEHPTTTLNLQFLLFNPLPLFYIYKVARRRNTCYWNISVLLLALFLIGGFWQSYAEGIWSLALCLLLQDVLHLKNGEGKGLMPFRKQQQSKQ